MLISELEKELRKTRIVWGDANIVVATDFSFPLSIKGVEVETDPDNPLYKFSVFLEAEQM